ncbi:MAG: M23 family metallopeptidase [Acidobacteriota bacterium]
MISENAKAGKTSKAWRSPGFTEQTHTGRAALVILGLCIICSVVVFNNLKAPPFSGSGNRRTPTSGPEIKADNGAKAVNPRAAPSDPTRPNDAPVPPGDSALPGISPPTTVNEGDLAYLRTKNLLIPVEGVTAKELHDTFYQSRSESRIHQALDIMAPQGTPVLASADGRVKLFTSDRGGTMIYVTDPSGLYVYYYGHLQRYADGMYDGKQVRRGEVIGYVGDTGNAGAGNFHLHFGIAKVTTPGRWSGGEPINPYPLLTTR